MLETYYTVDQVAEILSRSSSWVYAQCRQRKIPHHRLGRGYRLTEDDLREYATQTRVPAVPPPVYASCVPVDCYDLVPSSELRRRESAAKHLAIQAEKQSKREAKVEAGIAKLSGRTPR
jgi:excisionase family DNA binding protein